MKRITSCFGLLAILLVLLTSPCPASEGASAGTGVAQAQPAGQAAAMPLPLKVSGNAILNSENEPVILRGVNAASLEWTSDGQGHILQSVRTAIQVWHVNIVRLPLAQDRWFGKAPEQKDEGAGYRALVKEVVDTCATQNCYIVLDLHWSDCGQWGTNIAQHSMPDQNSVTFWKDCAAAYRNHPAVIFDLYNEPHDVTWEVWRNGGTITDKPNTRRGGPAETFQAVGMQVLLETVRATGAKNVVIAGGLDWAYDLSGILAGRQLSDPQGNGVIYANHAYNNKGHSVDVWIERMEKATAKLPVIVSEFGGSGGPNRRLGRSSGGGAATNRMGDDWLLHVIQALQDHPWSWIAWDFHPHAGPTLISGWDYAPTRDFGVFVEQALAGIHTTRFSGAENPLSEGGSWMNNGLDWAKIRKDGGIACGTQTGTNTGASMYDDSYAHLSGFPPDQEAWGTARIAKPDASCHQELEILLRWSSSPHRTTGYECFARCLNSDASYLQVVRWEGPLGKFTYLADLRGTNYGLRDGDVLKASIVGNVITVSINDVQKVRVTDDTYKTGNPGIGEFLACDGGRGIGSNADYGFSSFTARSLSGTQSSKTVP